jgi:hypothetical protein
MNLISNTILLIIKFERRGVFKLDFSNIIFSYDFDKLFTYYFDFQFLLVFVLRRING